MSYKDDCELPTNLDLRWGGGGDVIETVVFVGVAFSSLARILGECSTIHALLRFFVVVFLLVFLFFFKVEISSRTLISLFQSASVHSGLAS